MLRHFLIPLSTDQEGCHGNDKTVRTASRKRSAPVERYDRETEGEESPPFQMLGRATPERRASPKRKGAGHGVSCDTDIGGVEELD